MAITCFFKFCHKQKNLELIFFNVKIVPLNSFSTLKLVSSVVEYPLGQRVANTRPAARI